jgi:hypothetical protein
MSGRHGCMPACNEAPALEAAWQRYRSRDVVIVGVNYQDRGAARDFLRGSGIPSQTGRMRAAKSPSNTASGSARDVLDRPKRPYCL